MRSSGDTSHLYYSPLSSGDVSGSVYPEPVADSFYGASRDPASPAFNGSTNTDYVEQTPTATPSKHPRLLSLDAFRGLVIAWMIMSDDTGSAWNNTLDHEPWDGVRFADFVFPAFVFIVGLAVPLSARKFNNDKWGVSKKAIIRTIKLFAIGVLLYSGGFPAQYNLSAIRIPGILQRIGFVYLVMMLIHVWVPARNIQANNKGPFYLYSRYLWQFLACSVFICLYFLMTYGTNVPGCGYGKLDPECNAAGYWDRTIIGLSHMYNSPTFRRSSACSSCYPGDCPIPYPASPAWCWRPFDPEGIQSSFTAVVSGFAGLFFGHILENEQDHGKRLKQWLPFSLVTFAIGLIINFCWIPWNKNLWSISYVFLMAGVDGFVFSFFYYVIDVLRWSIVKKFFFPLICMGMNCILVFVLSESDASVDTLLRWFYISNPSDNLVDWFSTHALANPFGDDWATFLLGIIKVAFWLAASVVLHHYKLFWKV